MAIEHHFRGLPGVTASADLSSAQYRFVKIDGDCTVDLAGAGEQVVGVLMNCPEAGAAADVAALGDLAKVAASGALNAGDALASDANGRAVLAGAGDFIAGYAYSGAGALDEIMTVYLTMPGKA